MGWRIAGSVIAALMIAYGTASAVGALAHDTWSDRRVIDTRVSVVDVANSTGGAITVVGDDDADSVTIDMTVSRGLQTPRHTEEVEGNRLVVRNGCGWFANVFCQIDYLIHVPPGVSLIARADGGSVEVSNLKGFLDLSSDGGSLVVRGGEGESVRLDTDGGNVEVTGLAAGSIEARSDGGTVRLDLAGPPRAVVASSDGGDVEIVLPETPDAYRLDLSSDGGTTSGEVRTDPSSDRSITGSSDGGDVTVRYRAG